MSDQLDLAPKRRIPRMRRWTLQLAFFMRGVAAAWFVKGITWWMEICGFDPAASFESKRAATKAVAIGFGVLDLVAAVGLCLLSAWGGVMWLLAATTEIVLTFAAPRVFAVSDLRIATLIGLIIIYLFLSSLSAREYDPD